MKRIIAFLILYQITGGFAPPYIPPDSSAISIRTLLNEMCDRVSLTEYPDPSYQLFQAGSWDREELKGKGSPGWFGNQDYNHYIRRETNQNRTEFVILDAKGPGAITRWWIPQTSLLSRRIVRIYLDENPLPVIEENYQQFINGGTFVKWPFAFTSSDEKNAKIQYSLPVGHPKQVGADFYFPIPFSKACRVTLDDSVFYYNINYRMYKPGTKVKTFSRQDVENNRELLALVADKLLASNNTAQTPFKKAGTILKSQILKIDLPAGSHAINNLYLKINSKDKKQMNRAAVLQVIADGRQTVWSPVSEFFGGGVYARPVKNRNTEVSAGGWMISKWIMPYHRSAQIILKNYGDEPITAEMKSSVEDYRWTEKSMYFHADWHEEDHFSGPSAKDWNYIEINGKGKYAGDVLTIFSTPKNWWGEGDEKIYTNGESFPSQSGTGLEDYYGFAWGLANYFNSPFISMPSRDARGKDNWSGYNTVSRIRLLDNIPFDTSLKVDMEAITPESGVSYSVTSFWYGMDSATSNVKPDTNAVIRKLPDFAGFTLQKVPGETYPDPVQNNLLVKSRAGSIRYVGDQLDLLAWRDIKSKKKSDADGDDILGTSGYIIFGKKLLGLTALKDDSTDNLPLFISHLVPQHISNQNGTYLAVPGRNDVLYQTGLIEVSGNVAEKGVVSFSLAKNPPSSFRLGVMLDNASDFTKIGQYLWVTDSHGGNSGKVKLAKSNRYPDWYFFDITGLKEGDVITVHGSTEKAGGVFTIGALTFDQRSNAGVRKTSAIILENDRLKMVVTTDQYGKVERKYYAKKKNANWQLMVEGFTPQYQKNADSAIRLWDMQLNPYRYLVTGLPLTSDSSDILKLNDHAVRITLHRNGTMITEKISLGKDNDHFHIEVNASFGDAHPTLDYLLSAYTLFNVSNPDFVHTPGVKFDDNRSGAGRDQITGDRTFLAPALIVQQDENFISLVPDLDAINQLRTISRNARRGYLEPVNNKFTIPFVDSLMTMPTGIDFNRHTGLTAQPVMTYGLMDSRIGFHTRFVRKEDDTSMVRELSSAKAGYAFDLFISASMPSDGYGRIAQFQWERYGSPVFSRDYHLAMPIHEYVKLVDRTIFYPIRNSQGGIVETPAGKMDSPVAGFADHGSWLEWQQDGKMVGGFRCSAPFWNDVINNSPFWNQARDAVGMFYWGQEMHNDSLVAKARQLVNFCLSAPKNKSGLFATVYNARDKTWGLGWTDPPHGKNVLFLRNADCYEIPALCKTGAHLLDYYIRNEKDQRIISYLYPFAEWLLQSIDTRGIVPSYVSSDMKASDILYESAHPAAAMWFLAEMYNATQESKFLSGAEKIGAYIEREIIPSGKWIDMEQYISCGAKPYSYQKDYWQGQWFRGTLCTIWATEGFAALHRATFQKRWLKDGEKCADYLSFNQCVWKPHFIFTANPFGGFVTDNSDDANLMDQRQAEVVKPFVYLGKKLHRQDLIERGVAAAQASCTLIILERHISNNIFPHPLFYPEGVAPENIDHEGLPECPMRTHPLWGEGSAVFTGLSEAYRSLGGLYVDPEKKIIIGVDGIQVTHLTIKDGMVNFRANGFLSGEFLHQPWNDTYRTNLRFENAKDFRVVMNGEIIKVTDNHHDLVTVAPNGTVIGKP